MKTALLLPVPTPLASPFSPPVPLQPAPCGRHGSNSPARRRLPREGAESCPFVLQELTRLMITLPAPGFATSSFSPEPPSLPF